jgi:hypothetical protein
MDGEGSSGGCVSDGRRFRVTCYGPTFGQQTDFPKVLPEQSVSSLKMHNYIYNSSFEREKDGVTHYSYGEGALAHSTAKERVR